MKNAVTTNKAVDPANATPVRPEKEPVEMMTIKIDPEMVSMQGIMVNGERYIGTITVPKHQALDLLRIQDEYFETRKKLLDPNVRVRMKNDYQKEALFLADPKENSGKKGFTRDYGLLPEVEWGYCTDAFKEQLLAKRKAMYNY